MIVCFLIYYLFEKLYFVLPCSKLQKKTRTEHQNFKQYLHALHDGNIFSCTTMIYGTCLSELIFRETVSRTARCERWDNKSKGRQL